MTSNIDELSTHLDAHTVAAVTAWADLTDRVVRVPTALWRSNGHTGAQLVKLFITDSERTRAVVLKVLPPGQDAEAAAHRRAVREAPERFRRHFVGQVFDSVRMPDGRTLTFQEPAGYSLEWRPMSDLPIAGVASTCEVVTRSLIADWNPDLDVLPRDAAAVLRDDTSDNASVLGHLGSMLSDSSLWVRIDDELVPNPFFLLGERSPLAGRRLDMAIGRTHGDLHGKNALIWQRADLVEPGTFILVDLMTYDSAGQLGRDVVRMLLSATAPMLHDLTDAQRTSLLPVFVRPDLSAWAQNRSVVVQTLRATHRAARISLRRCGDEIWQAQYHLSLVAQGIAMASFENLSAPLRWWFVRLAGLAARELFVQLGIPAEPPTYAPMLASPFRADAFAYGLPDR